MRTDGPFIEINATDLGTGLRFSFTQERFDLLCTDLGSFPVARAVTASSAVPVVFPTVVLKNYADQCDPGESKTWQVLTADRELSRSEAHSKLVEGLRRVISREVELHFHRVVRLNE